MILHPLLITDKKKKNQGKKEKKKKTTKQFAVTVDGPQLSVQSLSCVFVELAKSQHIMPSTQEMQDPLLQL